MFRTKHTYSTPAGGIVNTKKRTYEGPGRAPAGTKKVPLKTIDEVPVVTTHPDGTVTTSGFSSPSAARRAKRKQRRARRSARHAALATTRSSTRKAERRSQRRERRIEQSARRRTEAADKREQKSGQKRPSESPPPTSKPKTYSGLKTAGEPTLGELSLADRTGNLRTNRKGYVTTPKVRSASRELTKARRAVRKAAPKLSGPITPQQRKFGKTLARATGLSPKTVGGWMLAEDSGSAAAQKEASGDANLLNIGPGYDLGSNPKAAARQTAALINTGPSYGGIRASKGQGVAVQVAAIRNSPWDAAHYPSGIPTYLVKAKPGSPKAQRKLRQAEAQAAAVGLHAAKQPDVGPPPKKLVKRVVRLERATKRIQGEPYVWGGGHASFAPGGGEDCSGAVSYAIHAVAPNRMKAPLSSSEMGKVLKPGPGALTVFYNSQHTFLAYVNRHGKLVYWGTSVGDSGAGGLGPHPAPSAAYLAQYNVGHLPGMGRKQALQLGARFPAGGMPMDTATFPGMTLSSSGTTAHINEGAGVTKGKAGSSSRPIRLTAAQVARRKLRRIRSIDLGGKQEAGEAPSGEASPTLKALERKYGVSTA
jgi:cell wall-associated NlpC family hydrolase